MKLDVYLCIFIDYLVVESYLAHDKDGQLITGEGSLLENAQGTNILWLYRFVQFLLTCSNLGCSLLLTLMSHVLDKEKHFVASKQQPSGITRGITIASAKYSSEDAATLVQYTMAIVEYSRYDTKHHPNYNTKHNINHNTKHNTNHNTKHNTNHNTKHNTNHNTNHNTKHNTKHRCGNCDAFLCTYFCVLFMNRLCGPLKASLDKMQVLKREIEENERLLREQENKVFLKYDLNI